MNAVREISLTVWKAAIVTVAVILGFLVGGALGIPVWLQGVFLLPAALLFYRLSGETRPPIWDLVGEFVLISVFVLVVQLGSELVPEHYFWIVVAVMIMLFPHEQISRWCERRFGQKRRRSEHADAAQSTNAGTRVEGNEKPRSDSEERSQ